MMRLLSLGRLRANLATPSAVLTNSFSPRQRAEKRLPASTGASSVERREWVLPPGRSKNGLPHITPLNDLAIAILDEIAGSSATKRWPRKGLVFTTTGSTPVSGHSKAKRRLDAQMISVLKRRGDSGDEPSIAPWRVHDIRRTAATGFQRLGVRFEVTEAVLNHVSGSRRALRGCISGIAGKRRSAAR
jgi:integrase